MSEEELVDVAAAAALAHCSAKTIRRHVQEGNLPSRRVTVRARTGLTVTKILVRVGDLDALFGWTAGQEHVRKIRASAPPLSEEQKTDILDVFLEHLVEREYGRAARIVGPLHRARL